MMEDEKKIEELTSYYLKKLGPEDPSLDFTSRVMETIALKVHAKENGWMGKFGWTLLFIPLVLVIGWYFLAYFKLTVYLTQFSISILKFFEPIVNSLGNLFLGFKNLTISPLLLVGFAAIFLLLTIEELIGRMKQNQTFSK